MNTQKPSIPQGPRDFDPSKTIRRNYIIERIKRTFQIYGFLPIETPAMENLSVLTGKYGEEGDKLIFKILNSGDFLKNVSEADFKDGAKKLTTKIAEKALRYDLTVPFARYVVMNRNEITFPFKRYQIQPVWRADRPQKGRYREFMQCDADIIGTDSLICEAELVVMINEALSALNIDFTIKINNRKILSGITEVIGKAGSETELCVAIDKLDKIGQDGVIKELRERDFSDDSITTLIPIIESKGGNTDKIKTLKHTLQHSEIGMKGIAELEKTFEYLHSFGYTLNNYEFDITLARGLSYYTGAIFEVKANDVQIGSICGGGRYDNLTGVFGLPGVSGVGISFGIDRIYDVMDELKVFPEQLATGTKVMLINFGSENETYALHVLQQLRAADIVAEIYPDTAKFDKQMKYANKRGIAFVILPGDEERQKNMVSLKNFSTGAQEMLSVSDCINTIKKNKPLS